MATTRATTRATPSERASPVVKALTQMQKRTTAQIRVHVSYSRFEKDTFASAIRVFRKYSMYRTGKRNAVLIYLNPKKRTFAVVADEAADKALGQKYWKELGRNLKEDLLSTHPENALAICVHTLGAGLQRFFPAPQANR